MTYEPEAVVPLSALRLVPITRLGDALALSLVERLHADVVEDEAGLLCVRREIASRILEDDRVCQ